MPSLHTSYPYTLILIYPYYNLNTFPCFLTQSYPTKSEPTSLVPNPLKTN